MKARLKKHWFLAGIALVWLLGFGFPELCAAYQKSSLVDWSIALVMLCGGLTLETSHIFEQVRNWRAVGFSVLLMFVVAPLIFFAAAVPLRYSGSELASQLFVGFMILAAQSCTIGSGIVVTSAARGNVALALVVTIFNSMLSAVMTPSILRVALATDVQFDVGHMMMKLALIILLPVVIGQLVRPFFRDQLERIRWLPSILTQLVILSLIFMSVGAASDWMKQSPWLVVALIAANLLLHVVILVVNYAASTLVCKTVASRRALAICSSQKTLATGSYVWSKYFAENPLGGVPMILYHVVQLVFDSLLAHWLAARETHAAPPVLDTLERVEEKQI